MKLNEDKEYNDMISSMVDDVCKMSREEIASQMSGILDMAVSALSETDEDTKDESIFNAMVHFSVIRGYLESHMRTSEPSPLQISGMISRSVEKYTELLIEATQKWQEEEDNG